MTTLNALELAPLPPTNLEALAIDLSNLQNRLGKKIYGVLGNNFLTGRVLQIDYPRGRLRFYRSSASASFPKNMQAIFPFRFDDSIVMEGVAINGKKMKATIDTGSDGMFALTPAATEYLGLTKAALNGTSETSIGYNGTAENTKGKD